MELNLLSLEGGLTNHSGSECLRIGVCVTSIVFYFCTFVFVLVFVFVFQVWRRGEGQDMDCRGAMGPQGTHRHTLSALIYKSELWRVSWTWTIIIALLNHSDLFLMLILILCIALIPLCTLWNALSVWYTLTRMQYTVHIVYSVKYIFPRNRTSSDLS